MRPTISSCGGWFYILLPCSAAPKKAYYTNDSSVSIRNIYEANNKYRNNYAALRLCWWAVEPNKQLQFINLNQKCLSGIHSTENMPNRRSTTQYTRIWVFYRAHTLVFHDVNAVCVIYELYPEQHIFDAEANDSSCLLYYLSCAFDMGSVGR